MSTTTELRRYTDITWKQAAPGGFVSTRTHVTGWMQSHDLAVEMAERGLDFEMARLFVCAATSGMPVVVRHRGRDSQIMTDTVIIRDLGLPYTAHGRMQGYMHVSKWGGGHPIYYSEIISAGTPETVFEFDAHGEHHTIRHPAWGDEEHIIEPQV